MRPVPEVGAQLLGQLPGYGHAAALVRLRRSIHEALSSHLGHRLGDFEAGPQEVQASDAKGGNLACPQPSESGEAHEEVVLRPAHGPG